MKINFPKIKSLFSQPKRINFRKIPSLLSDRERALLILLVIGLLVVCGFWYKKYRREFKSVPASGGTLIEGIVAENSQQADVSVARLSRAGLMSYDAAGQLVGDMAISYQIEDAGKKYTFTLRDKFDATKLMTVLNEKKSELWPGIEISAPAKNSLVFQLSESYSPFLASTTSPLFDTGPYEQVKKEATFLEYKIRANYHLSKPNINEVMVRIYPDISSLVKALRQGEIMAAGDTSVNLKDAKVSNMNSFQMILPKYRILFFNLKRASLSDISIRQKIKNGEAIAGPVTLEMVTNEDSGNIGLAGLQKQRLEGLGLQINLSIVSDLELKKDILPSKNYDLLVYGIDYGTDPDPYPFWHSSQIESGSNLSNFSNRDADKIMEEARIETDPAKRAEKFAKFQEIFNREIPAIVLKQEVFYYHVSKKVMGVSIYPSSFSLSDHFYTLNQWYIKTKKVKK